MNFGSVIGAGFLSRVEGALAVVSEAATQWALNVFFSPRVTAEKIGRLFIEARQSVRDIISSEGVSMVEFFSVIRVMRFFTASTSTVGTREDFGFLG